MSLAKTINLMVMVTWRFRSLCIGYNDTGSCPIHKFVVRNRISKLFGTNDKVMRAEKKSLA